MSTALERARPPAARNPWPPESSSASDGLHHHRHLRTPHLSCQQKSNVGIRQTPKVILGMNIDSCLRFVYTALGNMRVAIRAVAITAILQHCAIDEDNRRGMQQPRYLRVFFFRKAMPFSFFLLLFLTPCFYCCEWLFHFLLCKALWITTVYEMCYTNKLALPCLLHFVHVYWILNRLVMITMCTMLICTEASRFALNKPKQTANESDRLVSCDYLRLSFRLSNVYI